jgi:hypothetical protein
MFCVPIHKPQKSHFKTIYSFTSKPIIVIAQIRGHGKLTLTLGSL